MKTSKVVRHREKRDLQKRKVVALERIATAFANQLTIYVRWRSGRPK